MKKIVKILLGSISIFFITLLVIISIGVYLIWGFFSSVESDFQTKEDRIKQQTASYLQNKYEEEFVISEITYNPLANFTQMKGYSLVHPDKEFIITGHGRETKAGEEYFDYNDEYPLVVWSVEAEKALQMLVGPIYSEKPDFTVRVQTDYSSVYGVTGKVPSFEMIKQKYESGISYDIYLKLSNKWNGGTSEEELQRIFDILQLLKEHRFHEFTCHIQFSDGFICTIEPTDVKKITKPHDLIALIKRK